MPALGKFFQMEVIMPKPRARDLGISFEGQPGPLNAITDIEGIEVGYTTLIGGESMRTGVTVIHPRGRQDHDPVFAGWFPLNGNGELTGAAWIEEGGFLEGPIAITNTHSVGVVRDAIIAWQVQHQALFQLWSCPVVAETADGWLNDMNAFYVRPEHVWAALDSAQAGAIAEGNVGGGTGMLCYEFKGGSGTASRKLPDKLGGYSVGVLAQTNFGRRFQLSIAGAPVGQHLTAGAVFTSGENPFREQGSLIVVAATNAPLLPYQLKRLAKRAALGMARTGGLAGNGSGDIFLAFSTANPGAARPAGEAANLQALPNDRIDALLWAAAYATEEAIVNSMIAAEPMTGRGRLSVPAIPHDELVAILRHYNRLESA
jgi:L-aminopeptidase/D-esterase-like protein